MTQPIYRKVMKRKRILKEIKALIKEYNSLIDKSGKNKLDENKKRIHRNLKKHTGKTIKDFEYNDDSNEKDLTIFFTDGTKLEIFISGEKMVGMSVY